MLEGRAPAPLEPFECARPCARAAVHPAPSLTAHGRRSTGLAAAGSRARAAARRPRRIFYNCSCRHRAVTRSTADLRVFAGFCLLLISAEVQLLPSFADHGDRQGHWFGANQLGARLTPVLPIG
jgi:hypothetical protein